jgi:[ribosomal protein S18]-alanine N-acetyltransferase
MTAMTATRTRVLPAAPEWAAWALTRLGPEDLDDLAALEARSHPRPWAIDALRAELLHDDAVVMGARCPAGALVAHCALRRMGEEAWILNIATDPTWRRRGLGRALLLWAQAQAARWGCGALWLEVRASNAQALSLYRHLGFSQVGARPGYYPPLPGATAPETALVLKAPTDALEIQRDGA